MLLTIVISGNAGLRSLGGCEVFQPKRAVAVTNTMGTLIKIDIATDATAFKMKWTLM